MNRYREKTLRHVASQLELSFKEKDEWGLLNLLLDFKLFKRGGRKKITNIAFREDLLNGLKVYVFDYHFVISTGKSSRRFKQSVFFIQSKQLGLPEIWMRPESLLHVVGAFFGFKDINFIKYPKFSKQYYLQGKDEELINYTFQDDVLRFFTREQNWYLEGIGYYFILYKKDVLFDPKNTRRLYHKGMKLWKMLKEDVL